MSDSHPLNPQRILQYGFAFAPPLILEAAVENRVFDVLDTGARTVEDLSQETGASVRGLRSILNALVSLEFVNRDSEGRYSLTPDASAFLVRGKPGWFGGLIRHTSTQLLPAWMHLTEVVRTGKPAVAVNQEQEGSPFFEEFVEGIFPMSYPAAQALGDALHLSESQAPFKVLDIAAGSGVWGIALAQKSPHVSVTAVDWEGVIPVTRRMAERLGVGSQFQFVAGDLASAPFGEGYQAATLGHILHSEGEERSRLLLRKVYDALAPGGVVAIAEMISNEDHTGPVQAMIFGVNMLVNTDTGDTYSLSEISGWLRDAGFVNLRTLDTPSLYPLILADKG